MIGFMEGNKTFAKEMSSHVLRFEFLFADLVESNADNEVKKMSLQALILMENIAKQVQGFKD